MNYFWWKKREKCLSVSELTTTSSCAAGKANWHDLGQRRNHQFARAKFRPHLLHAQRCGRAVECVLFSREKISQRELLADGQKVLLQGEITVYEARGQYQLIVRAVELQGVGALQVAFEKLKQKLAAEGLFAPERKRPLPRYPAAHRPRDFADGRGDPRRVACHATPESDTGNYSGSRPRARRWRGGGNCGSHRRLNDFNRSQGGEYGNKAGADSHHARRRFAGRSVGIQRGNCRPRHFRISHPRRIGGRT